MVKSSFWARVSAGVSHIFAPQNSGMSGDNAFMEQLFGSGPTAAGVSVTETRAMRISAAMACVRIMSSVPASIGMVVERREGAQWIEDPEHAVNGFLRKPNVGATRTVFGEMMGWKLHSQGDAIARLVRKGSNDVRSAQVLDRTEVLQIKRGTDGRLKYKLAYRDLRGVYRQETVDQEMILHVPGPGFDGCRSPSPIMQFARETLGISIATQDYQGKMLNAGARPSGALEVPQGTNDETVDAMRKHWQTDHVGIDNVAKTAILFGGAKFSPISFTSQEAEILQTRTFQVADVSRIWGVPLMMVQSTEKSTSWGSGLAEQVSGFIRFTLAPHLTRTEEAYGDKLFHPDEAGDFRVRYRLKELMRGTPDQQAKVMETLVAKAAVITRNEARSELGYGPIDGGNVLLSPTGGPDQTEPSPEPEANE